MNKILLSFDIEEFDLPLEYGSRISFENAISLSQEGTIAIFDILRKYQVKATFFCTTTFAENSIDIVKQIIADGHEIASHGCDHTNPTPQDPIVSKPILEKLLNIKINGFRQPRMSFVDNKLLAEAGYLYNSSLHPAFIPGRYMHLDEPRRPFFENNILQIPASVTPFLRQPIFWLACHNYPQWYYSLLIRWTLNHDKLLVLYFHPWEFIDLRSNREWKIPFIIRRNSGTGMKLRLENLIRLLKQLGSEFITFTEYVELHEELRNI